jgi:5'-3' exonuclease
MSDIFDTNTNTNMIPTFIFVDGSYYNFYRYYALLQWWKITKPDELLEDPYQNAEFLAKFRKTHVDHLKQIPNKLRLNKTCNPILIVGKDCKREEIWRMKHFAGYKGTRDDKKGDFKGGPFFKMAYQDNLFLEGGAKAILKHPHLEADDCIALSVKYLLQKYGTSCQIYIITSDKDYLQLSTDNVHLYNLSYKNIAASKSSTGNPETDLQIKIIMGDSSDNIPSIFPKCGPKTAQKCIDDSAFFLKKMSENPEIYQKQYELNQLLVDFNKIPDYLKTEFIASIRNPTN